MVPLGELRENPANFRKHPARQGGALSQVLDEVGLVQGCVLNRRSEALGWPAGELPTLVDGHLRVELARGRNEASLPVTVVDLSPDEERLVLATLDPLGALAETDAEALAGLIGELPDFTADLGALLAELSTRSNEPLDPATEWDDMPEFAQDDQEAWRTIKVHFVCQTDLDKFSKAIGIGFTDKSLSTWYPPQAAVKTADQRFKSDQ